jgi:hypothetical protein
MIMQDIIDEVNTFLSTYIDPIQRRFLFQSRPSEATLKDTPLILMLGNHSSGKSTFVNFFTHQQIQLTGMAPTDDDFSILTHGSVDKERTGSSLISNPSFGFEGLSQFGPKFLSHLKLRSVPNERLSKVMLVDTPGMIDSADATANRGYDFQGVVRWFAERADLIMLFFDPERPGTTAETLQVYTSALSDFDHKLLVIFNKVDQFQRLSDFARCYGNLCWNLGKVMSTKDLPQIYTTFVPRPESQPSPLPMEEFRETLGLLVRKMENTALQRVDNILTDISVYLDRILLHIEVLESLRKWNSRLRRRMSTLGLLLGGLGASWGWWMSNFSDTLKYAVIGGSIGGGLLIGAILSKLISVNKVRWFLNNLDQVFDKYSVDYHVHNERQAHLRSQWSQMSHLTSRTLRDLGISKLPKLKKREVKALREWRESRLPQLKTAVHQRESELLTSHPQAITPVDVGSMLQDQNLEPELISISPEDVDELFSKNQDS